MAVDQKARLPQKTELGMVATTYLVTYNVAQTMGWSALMLILLNYFYMYIDVLDTSSEGGTSLYNQTEMMLKIFQTAALLEVVHCAIGLVRSSVVLTAVQVASRVFLVWGVVHSIPSVHSSIGLPLFHLAWTITEIIRYSFYTFQLIGQVPFAIKWCRYTLFIVLYPIGVTGELLCLYAALPYVRKSRIYSISMPNPANIAFDYFYFIIVVMISYIPIFPQLYFHMLAQRKKVLSTEQKPKSQ